MSELQVSDNQPEGNGNGVERVFVRAKAILSDARNKAWRAVNEAMVTAYWEVGRAIVEEEQSGKARADYGAYLIAGLSKRLTAEFGNGYGKTSIAYMRQFYLTFPILHAVRGELTWTHYRFLLRVRKDNARAFYEKECIAANWSTRELERQINSLLFERLALSRDREGVLALANEGHEINHPTDLVKDPYVLEFTGIPQASDYLESDLETALVGKLTQFLLELGKGFGLMGRQQRITLDGEHFYIDLVFYNRLTRSFVLIDLKTGKLTHQDLGQMQMYVHYYQRERMIEGENPPIGIVLCTEKSEAVVRYTLPEGLQNQIFASRYQLNLPTEEELAREIQRERTLIERERRLASFTEEEE